MMSELEKLKAGQIYCCMDKEVAGLKENALRLCRQFNTTDPMDTKTQQKIIKELFGATSQNVYVYPNFNCDNGKNIRVGEEFISNYNVMILDRAPVTIGDYCMIGPNTLIATVGHPLDPQLRREKAAQAKPITIGNDVWIGGNCVILPDVTIGNNVVVGAGSVVTKDIPDNVVVAGSPAKIIKSIDPTSK